LLARPSLADAAQLSRLIAVPVMHAPECQMPEVTEVSLPTTRSMQRMAQRLRRQELDHLRSLCAQQAERIESLERDLSWAEDCARSAEHQADLFREMADDSTHSTHRVVCMSRDGELLVARHDN
jgi:hypothetical protein